MKHTDKFDLNIIETTDAFSPEPLNENTRALEALLAAKAAQADFDGLAGRVGTLETGRLFFKLGSYTGNGNYGSDSCNRLEFDFKPIALFIINTQGVGSGGRTWLRGSNSGLTTQGSSQSYSATISWGDRAIEWYNKTAPDAQFNSRNTKYVYLALGTEN